MIHPWFEFVYENFTTLCSAFWHATSIVKSHVLPRAKKRVRGSFERGLYFRERNSLGLGSFCLSLTRSRRCYGVAKEEYQSGV